MIKRDGRYCVCWESRMPKTGKASINASLVGGDIERFSEPINAWEPETEIPREDVVVKLKACGLEPYEVEMILDRFFDDLNWDDMMTFRGWSSTGTASYVLKRILSKLRKRGFKLDES